MCLSGSMTAQQTILKENDKIRITSDELGFWKQIMTFNSYQKNRLLFQGDKSYEIPMEKIDRLEVLRGNKRASTKGVLIGMAAGAGIGAVAGAAVNCDNLYDGDVGQMTCVGLFGGIGAGSGLLFGAIIGSISKTDNWVEIPSTDLNMQIIPETQSGLGLSLVFTFDD